MSDTFDSMLTPEQARMMYAAFLDRLPASAVAAQSIARNVENPLDFVSVANRGPSQVAPVTQGIAAMPPAADADLPPPRTTPVEQAAGADISPTAPQSQADALTRLRELIGGGERPSQADTSRDALTNFFFSMAASRNPSFFGQLGEAGQALARTQAEARTAARQERQVDVEAAYRAAAEARQAAEAEWARDPQNPLNIARLAAARSDEIRARAALASAGRESLGSGTPIELEGGRQGLLMRDGSVRELPGGARFLRSAEQADRAADRSDARRLQAQSQAAAEMRDNPMAAGLSATERARLIDQRAAQIYNYLSREGRPVAPTEGAAPATVPNIERMQYRAPGS